MQPKSKPTIIPVSLSKLKLYTSERSTTFLMSFMSLILDIAMPELTHALTKYSGEVML